jgi:hypothetical protein
MRSISSEVSRPAVAALTSASMKEGWLRVRACSWISRIEFSMSSRRARRLSRF